MLSGSGLPSMRHSWTCISRLGSADVTQPAAGGEVRSPQKLSFLGGETNQAAHDPLRRGGLRAEGPFRRPREARLAGARSEAWVRGWDYAALVALLHSAERDSWLNFRAENRSSAEAGKSSDDTAAPRRRSAPSQTKPRNLWPICRGTESSSPLPSSRQ